MGPLPANPRDTGIERTSAAQVEAVTGSLQKPFTGLREFEREDFDTDVSVFDSFAAAFSDAGIVTGAVRAVREADTADPPDPNYDLEEDLKATPDALKFLQPFLDNPDDPRSGGVLSALADSKNARETAKIIRQARESEERMKTAAANGWATMLAGTLSGIGVDIAAAMGTTILSGGGTIPTLVTRGATAGRTVAAARLAALGALEAGGERAVQQLTNPLVSNVDLLEAAGIGAGAGGVLGFAFPTLFGNVKRLADDIAEPAPLTDDVITGMKAARQGSTVGAAVADPAKVNVPAKGSGSLFAKRLPKGMQEKLLRNPKRVIADIGAKGESDFVQKGLSGGRKFFDIMSRAVRLSTAMVDEVGGGAARAASAQDVRNQFHVMRLAREASAAQNYAEFMKSTFGVGGVRRALRNNQIKSFDRNLISQEQFEAMSDELAIARADGLEGQVQIIPDEINQRLDPNQRAALMAALAKNASDEDAYYQSFGRLEVEHGLIKDEELIPGYRPQRWDREEIAADPQGFQQYLLEVFSKEPDLAWVRQTYRRQTAEGVDEPVLGDNETFAALSKRDPETANMILEDWAAAIKRSAMDKAEATVAHRERELGRIRSSVIPELRASLDKQIARTERILAGREEALLEATRRTERAQLAKAVKDGQARLDALTARRGRLDSLTVPESEVAAASQKVGELTAKLMTAGRRTDRDRLSKALAKAEHELSEAEKNFAALRQFAKNNEELDAFLRRFGAAAERKAVRKAGEAAVRAASREARIAAQKTVDEQINSIRQAILDGESPFGFVDPEFVQSSARFKRRNIHLGAHRFRPEARRFLKTSAHDARASFDSSVGTQIAMRNVFGPLLAREGQEFSLPGLRAEALRGFDDDLRKTGLDDKSRRQIIKERDRAKEIFDHVFGEFTHADVTSLRGINRNLADLASIVNTATAAMSLGSVALAQLGDLGVMAFAGGRLGTGFRAIWRGGRVQSHMREIAKDDGEMAVLLQGMSVVDGSRFRALAEIDASGFDIPGSRFRRVLRATSEVAKIEGWANLMHVWNHIVRGGFGLDFARQIDKDLAQWGSLPAHLKTFYARHGVDEGVAQDIAAMLNKAHVKHIDGHLRLPKSSVWAEERPDLLMKYRQLVQSAGDEAMLDPQVADRPFLRSSPWGRMLLQFQSFMFTAGERFIAPLIQEGMLHPTSTRPYFGALAGMFLGTMTDGLKEAARGELDTWLENWGDDAKWKDNVWSALLRSPMMAGPSSMLTDVGMSTFGRVLNDRAEDIAGVRPLRQASARFKESQGPQALLGPFVGLATGTAPTIVRKFLEGDTEEAAAMTARRLPIANVFYLQYLSNLARDN